MDRLTSEIDNIIECTLETSKEDTETEQALKRQIWFLLGVALTLLHAKPQPEETP